RQQFHRTHLAQIHAHWIVGPVRRLLLRRSSYNRSASRFREFGGFFLAIALCFGFLASLIVLDNVDAHVGQHRHCVFDLLRRHFLGRKHRIQFVHRDKAALLCELYHLLDGVVGKVEQRTVGRALAFVLDLFLLFRRHIVSSPRG